jgi:molybdenum cofactor biosynthesis enzyme MoaA
MIWTSFASKAISLKLSLKNWKLSALDDETICRMLFESVGKVLSARRVKDLRLVPSATIASGDGRSMCLEKWNCMRCASQRVASPGKVIGCSSARPPTSMSYVLKDLTHSNLISLFACFHARRRPRYGSRRIGVGAPARSASICSYN